MRINFTPHIAALRAHVHTTNRSHDGSAFANHRHIRPHSIKHGIVIFANRGGSDFEHALDKATFGDSSALTGVEVVGKYSFCDIGTKLRTLKEVICT